MYQIIYELESLFWYQKSILYRKRLLLANGHPGNTVESNLGGYSVRAMIDKGILFIHIPKCAGTAVNTSLYNCLGGGHLRALDYRRMLGVEAYEKIHKFTVMRDPWERLYSAYRHLRGNAERSVEIKNLQLRRIVDLDFEGFVGGLDRKLIFLSELVLKPQYLFITPSFKPCQLLVDQIYTQAQISEVISNYGGHFSNRINASGAPFNKDDIYSETLLNRVRELYPEDVKLYNQIHSS